MGFINTNNIWTVAFPSAKVFCKLANERINEPQKVRLFCSVMNLQKRNEKKKQRNKTNDRLGCFSSNSDDPTVRTLTLQLRGGGAPDVFHHTSCFQTALFRESVQRTRRKKPAWCKRTATNGRADGVFFMRGLEASGMKRRGWGKMGAGVLGHEQHSSLFFTPPTLLQPSPVSFICPGSFSRKWKQWVWKRRWRERNRGAVRWGFWLSTSVDATKPRCCKTTSKEATPTTFWPFQWQICNYSNLNTLYHYGNTYICTHTKTHSHVLIMMHTYRNTLLLLSPGNLDSLVQRYI